MIKRTLCAILLILFAFPVAVAADNDAVRIDAENFPDLRFRSFVSINYDADSDGVLSQGEIEKATDLSLSGEFFMQDKPLDITGISYLSKIKYIDLSYNRLKNADFSALTELEILYVSGCKLKRLNVSSNQKLFDLKCDGNRLKRLSLKKNTALKFLSCKGNELTALSLNKNRKLKTLNCENNKIEKLNLRKCKRLKSVLCDNSVVVKPRKLKTAE